MNRGNEQFSRRYGPWALIAGGTEGLGREFALQAGALGLSVAVAGRGAGKLQAVGQELKDVPGIQHRCIQADLSTEQGIETVKRETGSLHIGLFVYNACKSLVGDFLSYSAREHEEVLNTNCRGPLLLTRYFGKLMCTEKRGGIILMSSMSGLQGAPLVASYAATKAFNLDLARSLWTEFAPFNVDVMACVAGATLTPNYLATLREDGKRSAPEMEPPPVVAEAFQQLGKTPYMVPGLKNKLAVFLLRRVLGKKGAVKMVAKNMYRQYGG